MLITTIEKTYTSDQVIKLLKDKDGAINIIKIDEVYYPYTKQIYSIKFNGILGKFDKQIMCNIDCVYGKPAIGQGKPKFVEREIDNRIAIAPQVSEYDMEKIGHDYVMKVYLGKMKLLHTPNISIANTENFHKLFYLVQCKDVDNIDYFILVDSIDGNFSVLNYN